MLVLSVLKVETIGLAGDKENQGIPVIRVGGRVQGWFAISP